MIIPIILFLVGLVLLIKGGDWFVDGATGIAHKFHVPDLLIGATVVSIGTTLPEVMVSATSAVSGHGEIAYGNAIGSIICNTALIAAISIAVKPSRVDKKTLTIPVIFFYVSTALYLFSAYVTKRFDRVTGVLLLLSGCSGGVDEYQCVHPETGTLVQQLVEGTGTVSYREEYSVIPTVSAKILSCSIEEGDTVTAGQVLYVLDSGALEDQITQARLSLNSAQASYAQAVDACTDLTVPAHASGTVTEVCVHVGDYVNTGTAIASLVDSANLTLTVPFAAEDAAAMAPGNTAAITFPGQAGTVTGTVERVYDTSTALSGGREGVYVEFSFRNPGAVLSGTAALASVGGAACMEAGTVANATEQSIYATQSGQVASLPIQAGTAVTAGQTVMTLENASLTNAVTNASLSVESAQVNLAQLEAKRADYTVTAPVDGTVLERPFKTGDYAAAATSLATLVQPDSLCVSVEIDELYINQVGVGQQARITFADGQTHEARDYDGVVSRMDDTGVSSGGVTDYSVEISLTRAEELKAGMNVTVEILVAQSEDCMSVPSEAVTGGVVRVLRDDAREPVEVPVETGLSGDGVTEIRSGLSPEDWVIVDAY